MKPEAQRIAIAEFCGWSEIRKYTWSDDGTQKLGGHRRDSPAGSWAWLPDYLHDLNAIYEAEKQLIAHSQQDRFVNELWASIGAGVYGNIDRESQEWIMIHSTAAQRAQALLKTMRLWVDTPANEVRATTSVTQTS